MTDYLIHKTDNLECVMYKDIEDDSVIQSLTAMRRDILKSLLFWLLVIFTGGAFYLISSWFPAFKMKLTYSPSTVHDSSKIYVVSKYFTSFTHLFKIHSKDLGELIVFKYQELTYYFDGHKFLPLFFDAHMPNKKLIDTYTHGYFEEEQIKEYRALYGICQILVPVIPLFKMIIREVSNPFYIFQVYSVILWYFEEYYPYAAAIVIITIISLVSSIVTTRRGIIALHNLAKKECQITVVRFGSPQVISSVELVPGDLVEITQQMDLPCDLCLISGGCIVEEGMLTGESVPVLKDSLPYLEEYIYDPDIDKRHTLYEGTKVIQTRNYNGAKVLGVVARSGFMTVKGRLIRSIMYPKPNKFKFYEDSMKFIAFLSMLTFLGFAVCLPRMIELEYADGTIALRSLDLITITVPPALPACMAAGVAFAITRLRRQRIYCIAPNRVNVAGKIDLVVFDKTGTLTEDGMNLLGVQSAKQQQMQKMRETPLGGPKVLLECMASCHSLAIVKGEIIGDTQDLQIFRSTGWVFEEPEDETYDPLVKGVVRPNIKLEAPEVFDAEGSVMQIISMVYELGILHIYHFTSKLKRMAVITKNLQTDELIFYSKGAPEVLLEKCIGVPEDISEVLAAYTRKGYRVIACAYKVLVDLKYTEIKSTKIEDFEVDLVFIGLIILQNKLKDMTIPSLKVLTQANIRTVMATGDAVLTGISVARECNLLDSSVPVYLGELLNEEIQWQCFELTGANKPHILSRAPWLDHSFEENYALALTGTAFNKILQSSEELGGHSHKVLRLVLEKCQVYARMAPEHKTFLVERLQDIGYLVGMCGDGANDCGALKTADVGISLSESDSSIAAPFTSQIPDISSVITVLREGRCALTTSIQCFKYMAMYSMIQFTSASFLYWFLGNLTNNQYLTFDLFTVMPLAVFMSMTGPYHMLSNQQPTAELISLRILSSVTIQAILQAAFQIGTYVVAVCTYYNYPDIRPGDTPGNISYEDTIIFYASWFQYQIICMVFSIGKPWKRPSYSNTIFTVYQIIVFGVTLVALFVYDDLMKFLFDVRGI